MLFDCKPYKSTAARAHRVKGGTKKPSTLTVDIHCHLHTQEVEDLAAPHYDITEQQFVKFSNAQTRELNVVQNKERWEELTGVEQRLKDMDEMLVDIQAISTSPAQYHYWADPDLGRQLSQINNDNLARIVGDNPDRFVGLGTLPMQNTELALAELDRCINELGFKGIEIGPNINEDELSADRLEKFWARCEELDIVIFMHPMSFTHGQRLTQHYLSNVIANPLSTTVAVHYLIFDGVMDRYPGLKIVLAHGGGYVSHYNGRLDHAHGARPDCCTRIANPPTSYLKKFYFDSVVFTPHQLEYLAKQFGTDHLLMGTDYPYDMAEYDPVEHIDQVESFSDDDKAKIWGTNAAALLKLKI